MRRRIKIIFRGMSALGGDRVERIDGKLGRDLLMEGLCTRNRTSLLIKRVEEILKGFK